MRVALVFGGRSGEHDVSIVSARSVSRALEEHGHEFVAMAIDREGRWAPPEVARKVLEASGDRTDEVVAFTGTETLDSRLLHEHFDVVFPALHGPYGEDGTIQGLFEMLDLPYVGCDVTASAVCMDKMHTKDLLVRAGLRTPPWVPVDRFAWSGGDQADLVQPMLELGLPLFVKPARLGSSVGISKVNTAEKLRPAIEKALALGPTALVEKGVDAREIEVAVLGNEEPRASLPGEIIPGNEFYDYDDKYVDDGCRLLAPAPLDETTTYDLRLLAVDVFRRLGCEGMARIDFFLDAANDDAWVNEVNTIPGFTAISMYPKLWQLTGLPYPNLVDELLWLAIERHQRQS